MPADDGGFYLKAATRNDAARCVATVAGTHPPVEDYNCVLTPGETRKALVPKVGTI